MAKKKKKNRSDKAAPDTPRSPAAGSEPAGPPTGGKDINDKVDEIRNLLLVRRTAESLDLVDLLRSKRRLMFSNFLLGLFRGIGFFLGFGIVGGLLLGILVLSFGWVDSLLDRDKGATKSFFQNVIDEGMNFKEKTVEGRSSDEQKFREMVRRILKEENLSTDMEDPVPEENRPEDVHDGEGDSPSPDGS